MKYSQRVTARLIRLAHGLHPALAPSVVALAASPGKSLRASLLAACGRLGLPDEQRLVRLGAIVELIHLASLLHDDVIDGAEVRRGAPAAHVVVGGEAATLAGLACFALVGTETADLDEGLARIVGDAVAGLSYGELMDVERAFDTELPLSVYTELAARKTGDLFGLACVLGAVEGGAADEHVRAAARFGKALGVAFQILDDCLDLESDGVDKPLHTDLRLGLFGAPVLCALRRDTSGELAGLLLSPSLDESAVPQVHRMIVECRGLEEARELAGRWYEDALAELDPLPAGTARDELLATASGMWRGEGTLTRLGTEVLVVGAGPAGAATAAELARHGIRTLLAGRPDDREHDVLLGSPAVRALDSLGALGAVAARPADGVLLHLGDGRGRAVTDLCAAVCDRRTLGEALRGRATVLGATHVACDVASVRRTGEGYEARLGSGGTGVDGMTVTARHVVIASGARWGVQEQAPGLTAVQRFGGATGPGAPIRLRMPPPRATGPAELPVCAWHLPGATPGTCTIGVSTLQGQGGPGGAKGLLDEAVTAFRALDPGFRHARPLGAVLSGPLDCGFTPALAVDPEHGGLRVGDAAGLANPFTGEGLSYAVESGLLAARAVAGHRGDPDAAGRTYTRGLAAAYVGFFETAQHASRRYHLAWRILSATADSDRPFFAKARRALLLPEGLAGLTAVDRMQLPSAATAAMKPFLLACDEVAVTTVRDEWPFIARLLITEGGPAHQRLRPAVPFYAALLASGRRPDIRLATVGAAIELATLGALSFLGPTEPAPAGRERKAVDWGTAAVVLSGDFLLSQASRLIAAVTPEISWAFADWLAELTALRGARLAHDDSVAAEDVFAALLEFPARIGAQLGGSSEEVTAVLRQAGAECGRAFLHAEDVLALRGERTRLDTTHSALLEGRISAWSDVGESAPPEGPASLGRWLAGSVAACRAAERSTQTLLDGVPHAMSRMIFSEFVAAVAGPAGVSQ